MVVENEVVKGVSAAVVGIHFPEQERADGVASHHAIEELTHLLCGPYELALNCREHVLATGDAIEYL